MLVDWRRGVEVEVFEADDGEAEVESFLDNRDCRARNGQKTDIQREPAAHPQVPNI